MTAVPSTADDHAIAAGRALLTRGIDKAFHLVRRLPCGTVAVNGFVEGNVTRPFGRCHPHKARRAAFCLWEREIALVMGIRPITSGTQNPRSSRR